MKTAQQKLEEVMGRIDNGISVLFLCSSVDDCRRAWRDLIQFRQPNTAEFRSINCVYDGGLVRFLAITNDERALHGWAGAVIIDEDAFWNTRLRVAEQWQRLAEHCNARFQLLDRIAQA